MTYRPLFRTVLTVPFILMGALSQANATDWNYSCDGWQPSSLQHRGPVVLALTDDQLSWSSGRKEYTAQFVDGSRTRKTYIDNASVYIVYGHWVGTSFVTPRLKINRVFYNSASVQFSELTCRENE